MVDEISIAMSDLRAASGKLNKLTDDATKTVIEAERFLNEDCSVGLPAYVTFASLTLGDHEEGPTTVRAIGYERYRGKFRITISTYEEDYPEDAVVKAWVEATREDKLKSIHKLPQLVKAVAAATNEMIADATEVDKKVSEELGTIYRLAENPM